MANPYTTNAPKSGLRNKPKKIDLSHLQKSKYIPYIILGLIYLFLG